MSNKQIVYVVAGWDYNGTNDIYLNLEDSDIYHDVTNRFKHGNFVTDAKTLLSGLLTAPIVDRLPLFWCQCARYVADEDIVDWSMATCPGLDLERYVGKYEYLSKSDVRYWRGKESSRG